MSTSTHATGPAGAPVSQETTRPIFQHDLIRSAAARYALAALRLILGFTFLWPFLDKLFGFGYATPSAKSWLNGGMPARGFMKHTTGPFGSFFGSLADTLGAGADWLFMLGLAGIGLALITGCGLKIAAIAGSLLLLFMYLAELPFADHGAGVTFTNPLVDVHWIEAAGIIVCAATLAGDTLGLGRWWGKIVGRGILR